MRTWPSDQVERRRTTAWAGVDFVVPATAGDPGGSEVAALQARTGLGPRHAVEAVVGADQRAIDLAEGRRADKITTLLG